jgi:membrane-associated protein
LWSSIEGALWSVYTCGLAYLIATAPAGFPLDSVIIAGTVTTIATGVLALYLRRARTNLVNRSGRGSEATETLP